MNHKTINKKILSTFNFPRLLPTNGRAGRQLSTRKGGLPAQAGFTLIELMVSLTLFVIVVMAVVSSLYTVNVAARKVNAMKSVLDNLNFAMENMSRTIRTGTVAVCGGTSNGSYVQGGVPNASYDCPFQDQSPAPQILIGSTLGTEQLVEYQRAINGTTATGEIEKRTFDAASGTWGNWIALTAPEIDVKKVEFYVSGADAADNQQPNVIMFVQGIASTDGNIAPFAIQTLVTQRAAE